MEVINNKICEIFVLVKTIIYSDFLKQCYCYFLMINQYFKWKNQNVKPNFMEKTLKDEITTFVDRNKVITEEKDVIKKSEDHFENSFFDKFSILRSLF